MSKSSGSGGSENYFDIDDILASQEKIPCKFEVPVYNLGKFKDQITAKEMGLVTKTQSFEVWETGIQQSLAIVFIVYFVFP